MILGSRAITIIVRLGWLVNVCSLLIMCLLDLALNVLAGLLVNMTLGLVISMWVNVICRRLLFDSNAIPRSCNLRTFRWLSSLVV